MISQTIKWYTLAEQTPKNGELCLIVCKEESPFTQIITVQRIVRYEQDYGGMPVFVDADPDLEERDLYFLQSVVYWTPFSVIDALSDFHRQYLEPGEISD